MIAARGSLDRLVAALQRQTFGSVADATVIDVLTNVRVADGELAPFVTFHPARYTRNLVYRDERFELLVLCWAAGTASPVHDHGRSRCYVKVQRGQLLVDDYALVTGGHEPGHAELVASGSLVAPAGTVDVRTAVRDIHRMTPLGGPAISLHVYATPLDRCLIFDLDSRSCRRVESRYDTLPAAGARTTVPSR